MVSVQSKQVIFPVETHGPALVAGSNLALVNLLGRQAVVLAVRARVGQSVSDPIDRQCHRRIVRTSPAGGFVYLDKLDEFLTQLLAARRDFKDGSHGNESRLVRNEKVGVKV